MNYKGPFSIIFFLTLSFLLLDHISTVPKQLFIILFWVSATLLVTNGSSFYKDSQMYCKKLFSTRSNVFLIPLFSISAFTTIRIGIHVAAFHIHIIEPSTVLSFLYIILISLFFPLYKHSLEIGITMLLLSLIYSLYSYPMEAEMIGILGYLVCVYGIGQSTFDVVTLRQKYEVS